MSNFDWKIMSEELMRKEPPDVVEVENPSGCFNAKILTQLFQHIMKSTATSSLKFPILLVQIYQSQIWL
jgi:hypothetical protein